jgi:hypothetical protein
MAFGRWISTTRIDKKNLVTSLFSSFFRVVLVGLLELPYLEIAIAMVNMAMVG